MALKPTHLNSALIPPMMHACYATIDDKTPMTIKQLQRTSTLVLTQGLRLVASLSTRVTGRSLSAQVLVACSDSTLGEFSSTFGTLEAVIALVLLALQSDQTAEEGGGRGLTDAPWTLFSPASIALSLWGGALAYSDPRGIVAGLYKIRCSVCR